tara:strand:+ start:5464 stop:5733 length:270 start_codon:yes stop_codon:yes gene_type:complete
MKTPIRAKLRKHAVNLVENPILLSKKNRQLRYQAANLMIDAEAVIESKDNLIVELADVLVLFMKAYEMDVKIHSEMIDRAILVINKVNE